MRRNKPILILDLQRGIEEAMHESQQLLVVIQKAAAIYIIEVEIEKALVLAALEELVQLIWLLGQESRKVNRLHRVHGHLCAVPLDSADAFVFASHGLCLCVGLV